MLRKGNKFDLLVSYLSLYVSKTIFLQAVKTKIFDRNHEHIPPHIHHTYSRLCKVLLKQDKISYEYRKHAVNVLGSPAEQESYFIEYEMYDDLADFYVKQQRHEDHFYLLVQRCHLEEALNVWFEQQLSDRATNISEDTILNVVDYVCAGKRMTDSLEIRWPKLFKESNNILAPKIACRVQEWMEISRMNLQGSNVLQDLNLKSLGLRAFVSIKVSGSNFFQNLQNF